MIIQKPHADHDITEDLQPITQENCPARCKRSGMCYGKAWFLAKPGPAAICNQKACKWKKHMQELS